MLGASAVVLVADRRRLLLGESVAISALAFVVLGGIAVGGVPTPSAYSAFARGLIEGWADLLSSAPPADITEQLRALPFAVAWLAAAVGGEIARHSRRPGLPAIGPILALALSLLFTVEERWLALAQGAGILAGTFALIVVGQRFNRTDHRPRDDEPDDAATATNRTPSDARRRRDRRRRPRRPRRRAAPAARRGPRALRPAPVPGAAVRPAGRAQPARPGQGVAEGRAPRRRHLRGRRRHADRPLAGRRDERLRRCRVDGRRPRARSRGDRVRAGRHAAARARRPAAGGCDDRRAHRHDPRPRRLLPADRGNGAPPRPAGRPGPPAEHADGHGRPPRRRRRRAHLRGHLGGRAHLRRRHAGRGDDRAGRSHRGAGAAPASRAQPRRRPRRGTHARLGPDGRHPRRVRHQRLLRRQPGHAAGPLVRTDRQDARGPRRASSASRSSTPRPRR